MKNVSDTAVFWPLFEEVAVPVFATRLLMVLDESFQNRALGSLVFIMKGFPRSFLNRTFSTSAVLRLSSWL